MKEYKKPNIFIEEINTISNICYVSQANGPLDSFENDGYGVYEDFKDIEWEG